ncbi:hypothetical protein CFE70_010329 [Pyrenophora teres f. teres 0-1]
MFGRSSRRSASSRLRGLDDFPRAPVSSVTGQSEFFRLLIILISPVVIQEEEIEECEAIEGVVSSQDLSISLFDMDLTGGFKVNNRSRDVS